MNYHDAVDMFISLICTNDQFYDNGLKLRMEISNKFNSYVKSKLNFMNLTVILFIILIYFKL